MFIALLDTSVLWPSVQRDFLLSLAIEGLYRPRWSAAVLAELEFHEARKLEERGATRDDAVKRAARLVSQMTRAFPDGSVQGWEPLEGSYGLPDADDEHVVAAAVVAGAGVIVTSNLKDFPSALVPEDIQVVPPTEFVRDTVLVNPAAAHRALEAMSKRYTSPARTPLELLETLQSRYNMLEATEILRGDLF